MDLRLLGKVAKECLDISTFQGNIKYLFQHSLDSRRYYDILLTLHFEDDLIQASSGMITEYLRGEKTLEERLDIIQINDTIRILYNGYKAIKIKDIKPHNWFDSE